MIRSVRWICIARGSTFCASSSPCQWDSLSSLHHQWVALPHSGSLPERTSSAPFTVLEPHRHSGRFLSLWSFRRTNFTPEIPMCQRLKFTNFQIVDRNVSYTEISVTERNSQERADYVYIQWRPNFKPISRGRSHFIIRSVGFICGEALSQFHWEKIHKRSGTRHGKRPLVLNFCLFPDAVGEREWGRQKVKFWRTQSPCIHALLSQMIKCETNSSVDLVYRSQQKLFGSVSWIQALTAQCQLLWD